MTTQAMTAALLAVALSGCAAATGPGSWYQLPPTDPCKGPFYFKPENPAIGATR